MKKRLSLILRILVTVALLGWIVVIIDVPRMLDVLRRADIGLLALALVACVCGILIMTVRWQQLLKVQRIPLSFPRATSLYFIGFFFNNFLPTSIGGDVVRIYKASKLTGRKAECLASVLVERLIGFIAIASMAVVGLCSPGSPFASSGANSSIPVIWVACAVLILLGITLVVATSARSLALVERLLRTLTWRGIGERLAGMVDAFHYFRNQPIRLLSVYVISLFYQGSIILYVFLIGRALGLDGVGPAQMLVCVPVIAIVSMFPSINGLGVREGGYVYMLSALDWGSGPLTDSSGAAAFSILITAGGIAVSLLGGILLLFERNHPRISGMGGEE